MLVRSTLLELALPHSVLAIITLLGTQTAQILPPSSALTRQARSTPSKRSARGPGASHPNMQGGNRDVKLGKATSMSAGAWNSASASAIKASCSCVSVPRAARTT